MVALNLDEDSEFRDALMARGIIPALPPTPPSPSSFLPSDADLLQATLQLATPSTLQHMAEETVDSDEERMFESYRIARIKEMRDLGKKGKFGSIKPIGRSDWEREVTMGSKEKEAGADEEEEGEDGETKGEGTGVVCFLYKDAQPASVRLQRILASLAPKFPRTKFISIIGSQCIENYPDRNLPTLIVYRNGEVTTQVVGDAGVLGRGEERDIQQLLLASKAIHPSHMPLSALSTRKDGSDSEREDSSEEEWGGLRRKPNSTSKGGIRNGTAAGGRGRDIDEDDDDFDL